jgi:Na+/H+-dicarboxylate symporter
LKSKFFKNRKQGGEPMFKKAVKLYFRIPLFSRILAGFLLGIVAGLLLWKFSAGDKQWLEDILEWIAPFGSVLVNMLKMIVIPIIFFSLVTGTAKLPLKKFGTLGILVLGWYLATSLFAAILGTVVAYVVDPGKSAGMEGIEKLAQTLMPEASAMGSVAAKSTNRFAALLDSLFRNPFEALAQGNFLSIIIFSILLGLALRVLLDTLTNEEEIDGVKTLVKVFHAAQEAVFKIVKWIMEYFPIGVFALATVNFSLYGPKLFGPYLRIAGGVIIAVLLMIFVVYPLLMFMFVRKNPYKVLGVIQEAIVTAFATRSSAATLPVSMRIAEEDLKIKNELAAFSLPLGATINMDGACVHLPVFAVLAANLFGLELGAGEVFLMIVTVVLASIGAGGVPGGSLMLLFIVLQTMNLDPGQSAVIVALAMGINPVLDMFETANNVAGDNVCTYVVAETQNMKEK